MAKIFQIFNFLPLWVSISVCFAKTKLTYVKHSKLTGINWGLPLAGHKLSTKPINSSTAEDRVHCMMECTKTEDCIAINLGPQDAGGLQVCETLSVHRYFVNLVNNLTVAAEWTYMGIRTKCDANPCPSGKPCIPNRNEDKYTCLDPAKLTNCLAYLKAGHFQSGLYPVLVNNKQVLSYCDQTGDGGGWLVIQRRYKPSDFFKIWEEYKHGFGNLESSFWWGNENIHQITSTAQFELRIDLKRITGETGYAKYTGFKLSNEGDGYRLHLDENSYNGNIGDSMHATNNNHQPVGKKFSTKDKDQDNTSLNCAARRGSAWWYGYCSNVDLNGAIIWSQWSAQPISQSEMKIRPVL